MSETFTHKIVDGITGETTLVPFTEEEIAAVQAYRTNVLPIEQRKAAEQNRASAYRSEADPLFFKAQRGEATTDEWTAKVAEIKARFPYPNDGGVS